MKPIRFRVCQLFEHCGEACAKCTTCEAPKGKYGVECEDCNNCRDSAKAVYQDLQECTP